MFSFRWTGAALACGVMGFPLLVRAIRLSIEAIDRRLEDAAATLGANRSGVFVTVTLPLALPGIIAGMVLCFAKALGEFGATITFVSNIPGRDADHLGRDLHLYAGTRRRRGRRAARPRRDRHLAGGAHRLRMARAARRHAPARGVTCLRSTSKSGWATSRSRRRSRRRSGVTALFGPSGAGKTSIVNMIAGLLTPDRGRIALDGDAAVRQPAGVNVPAHRRRIGYVFQEGRLFPHLTVARTSITDDG